MFVAGHPGTTQRLLTVAQLKTERDLVLPFWLLRFSELRGRLLQFSRTSPEAARTAKDYLDTIENSHKVRRMQLFSLLDDRLMTQKTAEEEKLRAAVTKDAALKTRAGSAWDDIAAAQTTWRNIYVPYVWIEQSAGFNSDLFSLRTPARARRRGTPQTERRAAARVHRRSAAGPAAAVGRRGPRSIRMSSVSVCRFRSNACVNGSDPTTRS